MGYTVAGTEVTADQRHRCRWQWRDDWKSSRIVAPGQRLPEQPTRTSSEPDPRLAGRSSASRYRFTGGQSPGHTQI